MRTPEEITREIVNLEGLLEQVARWNPETREMMQAQRKVLNERLTEKEIETNWYHDESDSEYQDGDNDLYHAARAARSWAQGEPGYDAPSTDA